MAEPPTVTCEDEAKIDDFVRTEVGPDGRTYFVAHASVRQPDPTRRFTAFDVAEMRAKALLLRQSLGLPPPTPGESSTISGHLSGVTRIGQCYIDGVARVRLRMPAP